MASGHLQLMSINSHPTYENGDVLGAVSHLAIRRSAASRICFKRQGNRQLVGLNGNGLIPHAHVLKDWHEACCQFKFERLNRNQVKYIRLSDMAEIIITTGVPHTDHKGKPNRQMDVDLYFKRQLATFKKVSAQGKAIFSDDGDVNKVTLYGGNTDTSSAAVDAVWTAITNKTGKLEADEITYKKEPPFGSYQRRRIVLRVDDFTDLEGSELVASLQDLTDPENPITIKKRKSFVDWESDLGLSAKDITDSKDDAKDPDLRTEEKVRGTIVKTKTI